MAAVKGFEINLYFILLGWTEKICSRSMTSCEFSKCAIFLHAQKSKIYWEKASLFWSLKYVNFSLNFWICIEGVEVLTLTLISVAWKAQFGFKVSAGSSFFTLEILLVRRALLKTLPHHTGPQLLSLELQMTLCCLQQLHLRNISPSSLK